MGNFRVEMNFPGIQEFFRDDEVKEYVKEVTDDITTCANDIAEGLSNDRLSSDTGSDKKISPEKLWYIPKWATKVDKLYTAELDEDHPSHRGLPVGHVWANLWGTNAHNKFRVLTKAIAEVRAKNFL